MRSRGSGASARSALAVAIGVVAPVLAGAPRLAAADPTPADAAAAEALFSEGRRLMSEGNARAACPKFAESYRLDPALGALLNLAACHEEEGRTASAWSEYKDAATQAMRAGDAPRQKLAEDRAAALEPLLARVVITAAERPEGFTVARDGVPLGEASLGAPLPIDPGEHWISAQAPGRLPWRSRVEVARGGRITVAIPELELAPPPRPPHAASAAGPSGGGRRIAGFVLGGVGVAALALGGVFVGLTASKKASADELCPEKRCDAAGLEAIDTARTYAWVANGSIGAGALGVIAGAYLLLTGEEDPAPAASAGPAAVVLTPSVGPDGAAVRVRLRF